MLGLDDKREIAALLTAMLSVQFLSPQLLYAGKAPRCHPRQSFPSGWDIYHSYAGKTPRCYPRQSFPSGRDIYHSYAGKTPRCHPRQSFPSG